MENEDIEQVKQNISNIERDVNEMLSIIEDLMNQEE